MRMPVITLKQPWASWIANGLKTIETRTHGNFKSLVGKDILIHAGKSWDEDGYRYARHRAVDEVFYRMGGMHYPKGVIVCVARLYRHTHGHGKTGVEELERKALCSVAFRHLYHLDNIRRTEHIPHKGVLNLHYMEVQCESLYVSDAPGDVED